MIEVCNGNQYSLCEIGSATMQHNTRANASASVTVALTIESFHIMRNLLFRS